MNPGSFIRCCDALALTNFISCYFCLDPFADATKGGDENVQGLVHIRIQQRNGRKTLTTIQGLSKEYDLKKIVRACKKVRKNFNFPSQSRLSAHYLFREEMSFLIYEFLKSNGSQPCPVYKSVGVFHKL